MKKQEEERKRKEGDERIKKEAEANKAAAKAEGKKERKEEKKEDKKDDKIKDEKEEEIKPAKKTFASICPKVKCNFIDSMLKPIEERMDKVLGTSIDPFTGYKNIINKVFIYIYIYFTLNINALNVIADIPDSLAHLPV